MVNISIDVTDLGGEARPGDKVVLWKPAAAGSSSHAGRVISTAPVDVFLTNGKATVPDVEPGEMRVLLQCRGVESQGPIDVTVPDGNGTVTLRSLIESQFEYAPPIVSAVQEAAANASASEEAAIRAQVRSEAAADRADAKVDDAINNGANLVRNEVKQDADRAVSARQAATQSESNAAASEGAAAASASSAATSETNAKQSETNAGDYAAVATTAATEAVDAMDSVSDIIGAKYATQEYVDTGLAPKADKSELESKASKAEVEELRLASGDFATREYVDSQNWVRRIILNGEDLNDLTETGLYLITLSNTMASLKNRPFGSSGPGFLVVTNSNGTIIQELTNYSSNGPITMSRTAQGGAFQEWVNPATVTKPFLWADFNSAQIEGDYDISTYAPVRDAVNRPPFGTIPAAVQVRVRRGGGSRLIQSVVGVVSDGIGERWQRARLSTGMWAPWEQIHTGMSREEITELIQTSARNLVDATKVETVGDSQVGAAYSFPAHLAGVSGQTVINFGISGYAPDEILVRSGVRGVMFDSAYTLPPNTDVPVTPVLPTVVAGHRARTWVGKIGEDTIYLKYLNTTDSWALYNGNSVAVDIPAGSTWWAAAKGQRSDFRRIVWFGGNSIRNGKSHPGETPAEHVMRAYSDAISAWGDTTIVCGYVPAHGDTAGRDAANEINAWLGRAAPAQFLDMRYRIQQASPEILGRALTPSEEQDIANGFLPRALYRDDLVHLTDEAHVAIAGIVAEFPDGASSELAILTNPQGIPATSSMMGLFSGTGSPEGKIPAPVGSIYTDTAATNGAIRWIKASGAGATGWRVEHGDTGWRDITSLITSSPALIMGTGAKIAIRRTSGSVFFRVIGPATMGGTFGNIVAAQPGLRPDLDTNSPAAKGASFRNTRSWIRLEDGTRDATLAESGRAVETMWSTTEAWPTTLPGTPL